MTRRQALAEAAAVALLLLIAVVGNARSLGGAYYHNDFEAVNLPSRAYVAAGLREGVVRWWSPEVAAGFPLFAEGQEGTLYPGNAPFLALPPWLAMSVTVLLHLFWGGLGLYVLMRRLGCGRVGAVAGGAVFLLSGPMHYRAIHLNMLQGHSWLPWALLAAEVGLSGRRWAWPLVGLVLGLQVLAGHPLPPLLTGTVLPVYLGARMLQEPALRRRWAAAAGGLVGAFVLAGLLAAARLLPQVELLGHAVRRADSLTLPERLMLSVEGWHLYSLIAPGMLGGPFEADVEFMFRWGTVLFWEWGGYIGLLPLLLWLLSPWLGRRRERLLFAGLGLLGLMLAMGRTFPLYGWLSELPGWSSIRIPGRMMLLFAFGAAGTAGFVIDDLAGRLADARRTRLAVFGGSLLAVLVVAAGAVLADDAAGHRLAGEHRRVFVAAWAQAAALGAAALAVLAVRLRSQGPAPRWALAAAALMVGDLLLVHHGYHRLQPPAYYAPTAEYAALRATGRRERVLLDWELPNPYRPLRHLLYPDVYNLGNNSPLRLAAMLERSQLLHRAWREGDPSARRWAGALRIAWVSEMHVREGGSAGRLVRSGIEPWPMAWVVPGGPGAELPPRSAITPAPVVLARRNRLAVAAPPGGGTLVLGEAAYPGWQVYGPDGPRPAGRAYGTLAATPAPPAGGLLRLVYEPVSLRFGLFAGLWGLGLAAGWVAASARRTAWA